MGKESEGWHQEEYWHRPDFVYRQNTQATQGQQIESNLDNALKQEDIDDQAKDRLREMRDSGSWRGFVESADGDTKWARE